MRSIVANHRRPLLLVAALGSLASLVTLSIPWLAGELIGGLIDRAEIALSTVFALLLVALAAMAAAGFATTYLASATGSRMLADLRLRVYRHLQKLPVGWHEHARQGETLALMTQDVSRLSGFLTETLPALPARLLTALGAAVLMFTIDPRLALLAPLAIPIFYVALRMVGRGLRSTAAAIQRAEADVVASAEESLEMLPAIKAFTREDAEAADYRGKVLHATQLAIGETRIVAALQPAVELIAGAFAAVLVVLLGAKVGSGALPPRRLFSFLMYAALLARPVGGLAYAYGQLQLARGAFGRLRALFEERPEPGYAAAGSFAAPPRGDIAFEAVHFRYPSRAPLFEGLSARIGAGEVVALTGPNGAGKTTLVSLLLRFYDPQAGRILIDGADIAALDVRALRRAIGLVSQRTLLVNGTVRANLAFGLEQADASAIARAARLAQAWDFIADLPAGLDTEIGDRGVRLSGGQRQRLALARALVKDPPILVLDEATAMYDPDGEHALVEAGGEWLHGRTVILITHRPASLALASRVLELRDGRAIERSA